MRRRLAPVLLALAVLAGAACGSDPVDVALSRAPITAPPRPARPLDEVATVEPLTVAGLPAVIVHPNAPVVGTVVYFGGVAESPDAIHRDPDLRSVSSVLAEDGWRIAAVGASPVNWGNQGAVDAYAALGRRLDAERVMVLARSMGGLASLNCIASRCIDDIAAWAGIYPVVDQRAVAGRFAPQVVAAFGGPPPVHLIPVADVAGLTGVPMILWASTEDTQVPAGRNGLALARATNAAGGSVQVVQATGQHGDPSHFDARRIAAFFAAHRDVASSALEEA